MRRCAFLSPFGRRHSLLGHPVPPGDSAHLTVGLPRHHLGGGADQSGVSTFRTHETRLGWGVLCTPRATVSTRPRMVPDRRLPLHNGPPLSPRLRTSVPGCFYHEASTRIHSIRPSSLPLTCGRPDGANGPWVFP